MEYKVTTLSDPDYPRKVRERLGDKAPEKIYYNGPLEFLDRFTMSVICSDKSSGIVLWETNQVLFTVREYEMNYTGSWHSVIETEIFRLGLFKDYNTVTLFSAKGLNIETYDSFLLDRFYPPLHEFPERDEYFRRAEDGELLMLSVCKPQETRQFKKNILERNWIACVLGDIVFIPYGPKGSKTYVTAKKVIEADIPAFTIDHPESADLHKLGIPGFNRKTVKRFLEEKGAKQAIIEKRQDGPEPEYEISEHGSSKDRKPTQTVLNFKKIAEKHTEWKK